MSSDFFACAFRSPARSGLMALGTQRDPKSRSWSSKIPLGGFKVALGGYRSFLEDDGKRAIGAIKVAPKAARPMEGRSGGKPLTGGWGGTRMTESALSARLKLHARPLGQWKGGLEGNHWRKAGGARGFNGAGHPKGPQESPLELKDPSWRL